MDIKFLSQHPWLCLILLFCVLITIYFLIAYIKRQTKDRRLLKIRKTLRELRSSRERYF